MTCIVGYIDKINEKVILGSDSLSTSSGLTKSISSDGKLFKNGDFIFGTTGSIRMKQLLRFSLQLPEINSKDIFEYMCTDFVNTIRECFKNGGFLQKDSDGDEKGGTFLVGYKNRLFQVNQNFQVFENIDGFDSIGCGADYALGSIYSTKKNISNVTEIILEALEAAENFSAGVSKPFKLIET